MKVKKVEFRIKNCLCFALVCLTSSFLILNSAFGAAPPSVGIEDRIEITVGGAQLEAKPVDARSKVVVRIAETRPHGTLTFYDLRYVGLEPGKYDLRDYLVRKDASPIADVPPIPVEVIGLLPGKHNGYLVPQDRSPVGFLGGYKTLITIAAVAWVALAIPVFFFGRRRKERAVEIPDAPPTTLADRMRPLVEQAAVGTLSSDGKAQLERMLLTHWRQKLGIEDMPMIDALNRLRIDAEAGALLRALESWLHRPPGVATVDIATLLEPYRTVKK